MVKGIIVYATLKDPTLVHTDEYGDDVWEVEAACSYDGGETTGTGYFNLSSEQQAKDFVKKVNHSFPPLVIGDEE
jgi:hypothetical protein